LRCCVAEVGRFNDSEVGCSLETLFADLGSDPAVFSLVEISFFFGCNSASEL
jgi:hypothetical protein